MVLLSPNSHLSKSLIIATCLISYTCGNIPESDDEDNEPETKKERTVEPTVYNASYGNDSSQQIADYYYPTTIEVDKTTHVIILIHGGAWSGGQKSDMEICVPFLREAFPSFLIVNMDYRLGTWSSPGYPKQIKDVQNLITFIRNRIVGSRPASNNATELKFTLLGGSAGAHLALLYSYKYNTAGHVKVVVDVVGPVDFTDPAYTLNPVYNYIAFPLVGPRLFILNPKPYFASSPVKYITSECPATIAFYGNKDL
ncbi:esterase LipQ-like [Folsomia candida]|uniref:esterase LipQ-like n=1 Tax=Folsomia candida TaxID=158441 RepID=UPI001604EA97|nr:esterase LipQ-like [Folsomia candida]